MTQAGRFQTRTLLSEQGKVQSYGGLDALTGLPVLIYRFAGRPMPGLGELASDTVPSALHTSFGSKGGELVVAFAPGYKPLRGPVAAEQVPALLLDSVRALHAAAEAGVLHGNLKPERFLQQGGHHLIEGYGVRWQPEPSPYTAPDALHEASFAGDVFSWAKSVEALCGANLPEALAPLFERALSLDPEERPSAKTLVEALNASLSAPVTSAPAAPRIAAPTGKTGRARHPEAEDEAGVFDPGELEDPPEAPLDGQTRARADGGGEPRAGDWPWSATERAGRSGPGAPGKSAPDETRGAREQFGTPPGVARPKRGAPQRDARKTEEREAGERQPGERQPGDGQPRGPQAHGPQAHGLQARSPHAHGGQAHANHHGAAPDEGPARSPKARSPKDSAAEDAPSSPGLRRFRPLLLAALLLAALILVLLSALGWQGAEPGAAPPSYPVTIAVAPEGLRPVVVTVVSSPPDSALQPGNTIRNVPGQVTLERGAWALQASYADRQSPELRFAVPETRAVTVVIPPQED